MNSQIPHQTDRRILVVGAGPAGLAAALAAASAGARVILAERQAMPGRKLTATGGGRCNLTNTLDPETFMHRFGPQGRFMAPALAVFSRDDLLARMADWGVACDCTDGFHYFPRSNRALDILNAWLAQLRKHGVELRLNAPAEALIAENGVLSSVRINGQPVHADAAVIAAGGTAWPSLGGGRLGYTLARQAGHTLVEPGPALTGLSSAERWPATCAGVTLPDAEGWFEPAGRRPEIGRGTLLFTHTGLSGPLILDLSGAAAVRLRENGPVQLRLRPLAGVTASDWKTRFETWRARHGRKSLRNCLDESLPKSLAEAACAGAGADGALKASALTADTRDRLANWLDAMPVTIAEPPSLARAMVTRGGVSLKEVNPKTLESRLMKRLYWAGEVLDLDGPCGGYNLQWAFSSGWLAGQAAAAGGDS